MRSVRARRQHRARKQRTRLLLLPETTRLRQWVREVDEFSVAVRAVLNFARDHGVIWKTRVPEVH